jgi:hypothetical protein
MLKYVIIGGVFGCITLFALCAVALFGIAALFEKDPDKQPIAFALFMLWLVPLFLSGIFTGGALWRAIALHEREQEKSKYIKW